LPGSLLRSHDRRLSRRLEWPIRAVTGKRPKTHGIYFTCIACSAARKQAVVVLTATFYRWKFGIRDSLRSKPEA
jgi:hypothetical protein